MRSLARGLQAIGLVLPITGLLMGISTGGMQAMSLEFGMLAGGVAIFLLGWWLQAKIEG